MTPFERLLSIRIGGGTERCHGIRHQGSYSNAAHSWGVAVIMLILWPEHFGRLAVYCIVHDVPEAWVGDIPAPVKKYCPEIKAAAARMESQIFARLCIPDEAFLEPADKQMLRACDSLELYLWASEQVKGGNQHAACILRELDGFYLRDPLPTVAYSLYLSIKEGNVEHATDALIRTLNGVA